MVMAPARVKRKVPPRFPPRFRLPLINSSLLAFRRVLSRIYLASFWKGRLGFGWIVTDTAHTCVAPPSINVASLPQSATSPSSLCLFSPENLYASWRAFSLDNSLLFIHPAIPSLYLFFPNSDFYFLFKIPWLPSIFLASGSDFLIFESTCWSLACELKLKFEFLLRFFARWVRYRRPFLQWRANPFDSSKLVALRVAGDRDWKLLERSSRLLTRFQRNLVLRQFFHRYFNNASPLYATSL